MLVTTTATSISTFVEVGKPVGENTNKHLVIVVQAFGAHVIPAKAGILSVVFVAKAAILHVSLKTKPVTRQKYI